VGLGATGPADDGAAGVNDPVCGGAGRQRGPSVGIDVHDLPEAGAEANRGGLEPDEKEVAEFKVEGGGRVNGDSVRLLMSR